MTIKITQVSTLTGEATLTIAYDNPSGSGNLSTFTVSMRDLVDRLITVRNLLGRPLTLTDARQALVALINEVRKGQSGVPERFDFAPYIGVELEAL
jgi:hypothetical protein